MKTIRHMLHYTTLVTPLSSRQNCLRQHFTSAPSLSVSRCLQVTSLSDTKSFLSRTYLRTLQSADLTHSLLPLMAS